MALSLWCQKQLNNNDHFHKSWPASSFIFCLYHQKLSQGGQHSFLHPALSQTQTSYPWAQQYKNKIAPAWKCSQQSLWIFLSNWFEISGKRRCWVFQIYCFYDTVCRSSVLTVNFTQSGLLFRRILCKEILPQLLSISCRFELFLFCFVQIQSGQLEALYSLLASYYFLYANVRHGLLHHLLEIYSSCGECEWRCCMTNVVKTCDSCAALETVLPFNPSLCVVCICWWMMAKPKILMFVSCDILPFL